MRMVHSWQSMLINSALLLTLPRISAQECQPLCWLDTQRTGRCQVSPVYMASLLDRLSQGSIWGEVATQNLACRSLNSSACSSPECNLHDDGSCMIRANWVGRKLGNASVGTKCGLLGQIMADEATCYQLEQSACSFTLTSCSWDQVRGVCGISPSHVLVLLRQVFREELVRIAFRRERCSLITSPQLCSGSCFWDSGTSSCTLKTLEALLAVIDEDCPLRVVLGMQSACKELSSCDEVRADGLQECVASSSGCQANPATLELDLLRHSGLLTIQLKDLIVQAIATCEALSDCAQSPDFCTKDLPLPSSAPPARWGVFFMLLSGFVLEATKL